MAASPDTFSVTVASDPFSSIRTLPEAPEPFSAPSWAWYEVVSAAEAMPGSAITAMPTATDGAASSRDFLIAVLLEGVPGTRRRGRAGRWITPGSVVHGRSDGCRLRSLSAAPGRLGRVTVVVVVGAGPVGMTAAMLLARRGIDVLVLDRHRSAPSEPRAVHLDDESLRVLQAAGVADAFAGMSRPMAGLRLLDDGSRTLAEFARGTGEHGWPQASMFHQPDLEAVLRAAASTEPRVELRGGVEVLHVEHPQGPVRLVVRDRDTGAEEQLVAEAVLGCDGAHSTV